MSYVTFQGNIEIGSHNTGDRYIQGQLISSALGRETKIKVTEYKSLLNRGGH